MSFGARELSEQPRDSCEVERPRRRHYCKPRGLEPRKSTGALVLFTATQTPLPFCNFFEDLLERGLIWMTFKIENLFTYRVNFNIPMTDKYNNIQ